MSGGPGSARRSSVPVTNPGTRKASWTLKEFALGALQLWERSGLEETNPRGTAGTTKNRFFAALGVGPEFREV